MGSTKSTSLKFLVEIEHRIPEPGETLESYAQEIATSFGEQLGERLPQLLNALAKAYEQGRLEPHPGKPGVVRLALTPEEVRA